MRHHVFFHNTFPLQFRADLQSAVSVVLIQSPYATMYGLNRVRGEITACIQRNVRVCIFCLEPDNWVNRNNQFLPGDEASKLRSLELVLQEWQRLGVHVNLRKNIHEKVLVIDEDISYDGSLNFLSYNQTKERANRWIGREKAEEIAASHGLDTCDICMKNPLFSLVGRPQPSEAAQLKAIGIVIARTRALFQLSQTRLTRLINVRQNVISDIERGARNYGIAALLLLCARLDLVLLPVPRRLLPAMLVLGQRLIAKPREPHPDASPIPPVSQIHTAHPPA